MNNTTLSLFATFGSAIIPFRDIVDKYLGITYDNALKQVKSGDLPLKIFRITSRQKAPYLVHIDDLSQLIENRRLAAQNKTKKYGKALISARGGV
ncbi:hypothetical protein GMES_1196 [Paraglaciecola mesophila KMM 241]|uniref:Pyocin activator protein PrtN n=1 Tax=Paraglaciecola mesophila KMM 241 TaxID=1128912 RepID=K6ZJD6_9ALTE|nr:pyocin activator PrtN family protein [Paraglaciecola mesophila]GAC23495.1 hypothetical protein GMES_1196 [Paraglaciecola mesophila KMM 241]